MKRRTPLRPALPSLLQRRSTDEFCAPPHTPLERAVNARVRDAGPDAARRIGISLADYWSGRHGTAAGLLELNRAHGGDFYAVPREATLDRAAAEEALGGDELVIDVQTHYVADRAGCADWNPAIHAMYTEVAPSWWKGLDPIETYSFAEYLRCVFLESETAVAVLTSGPGLQADRMLFDREMAGTRELFERLGAAGRLLNHSVVHPDVPGEVDAMGSALERYRPVGWKVYTLGTVAAAGASNGGWWLDDERTGVPFLTRAVELGVPLVCAHKGISQMVETGSPRDVGPAAAGFPGISFVIYHSGYELPIGDTPPEGPYTEATSHLGTNRLVKSLRDAGVAPGSNVFAELGSTWFCLIRRPLEAAHVLGKLLLAVGPDNVIWGTDSIWYGPTQVAIDAFRAFQIPAELRERHGYPELTPAVKAKILGGNASRVYGIDAAAARRRAAQDDLAWLGAALAEYRASGVPSV